MTRQAWIVVVFLAAVMGFLVLAVISSQKGEISGRISGGRFRAKQGAMRDVVVLIPSPTQERMESVDSGSQGPIANGASFSGSITVQVHQSALAEAARRALDAATPEIGIDQLQAYLASDHDPAEDSGIHRSLAMMHLQVVPADLDAAKAAANAAFDLAGTPEERHAAVYVEATILQLQGRIDEARQRIRVELEGREPTPSSLKLTLFEASLDEQVEDASAAEQAYKRVMDEALALSGEDRNEAVNIYRLAALKLARLYRRLGRAQEADRLAETLRRQFSS